MKKIMTLLATAILALAISGAAQAGTSSTAITLRGTAGSGAYQFGYTQNQAYSFTWVISNDFVTNAICSFSASAYSWYAESTAHAPIFTSIYGDGLSGTYVRPTLAFGDPNEMISQNTKIGLSSVNDGYPSYSLGLTAGEIGICGVSASNIAVTGFSNVFTGSFASPGAYYAARTGAYDVTAGTVIIYATNWSKSLVFTPTSMTIATTGGSAVPEPGTILAALSILGPAGMMFRRRKA